MKTKIVPLYFFAILMLFSACAPALPETTETEPPVVEAELSGTGIYPLSTRTGIADVDSVLAAVESGDPQAMRDLVRLTAVGCTHAEGLGGPPKCRGNEAEGTLVQVLPILGSEGHFMDASELSSFGGVDVEGVYAVYRVSETAYSEEAYPAGEYAIIFKSDENEPYVGFQIRGGIIRLDYIFQPSTLDVMIERDASEMILAPR